MKITCVTKYLKEAVLIADRNTSKNQTLPILNSLLLQTKNNNELIIRSTNLETAIELTVPCKIEIQGNIVISGKILSGFLSHILDENILLQNQKNNLFIKTKSAQTTLRGFSSEDFPLFPSIESIFSCSLLISEIYESLSSVTIAASTSDIKPELASVCFKIFKNTLKLAATDSFRLAERSVVSKKLNTESLITFLIPNHSVQELLRLFDNLKNEYFSTLGSDKDIEIVSNRNQIVFQNKSMRFISRLTEGNFPEYEQIIPKSFKTESIVKKSDIIHHIKLASVFVSRLNDLGITFNPQKKKLIFDAANPDIGEHNSELDISIQGEEMSEKFNWRYLLDGIMEVPGDYITLYFNGDQSPLMIKGRGDNSYLYLAMPMRGI